MSAKTAVGKQGNFNRSEKTKDIRRTNIQAAKGKEQF